MKYIYIYIYIYIYKIGSTNIKCIHLLLDFKYGTDVSKVHRLGGLSIQMIKLCGPAIMKPLSIFNRNCLNNQTKFYAIAVYLKRTKHIE